MLSLRRKIAPIGNAAARLLRSKHTLPELPYDYKALEPIISAEIMELHHKKHHQAYITNFNAAEEQLADALQKNDTNKIVGLQNALRFNGGGHLNHDIFWKNLTPKTTNLSPELKQAVEATYGDFATFKKTLITTTTGVQGSGWGWLGYNKLTKSLQITTCANQDPLQATTGLIPLLGIDVWEHAYYLQYKNVRPDYVEAIFDIINWNDVSTRFAAAKA